MSILFSIKITLSPHLGSKYVYALTYLPFIGQKVSIDILMLKSLLFYPGNKSISSW